MPVIKSKYKPLYTSDKRYFVLTGGRGSGKTFVVQDFLVRLLEQVGQGVLYTRYTMKSVETTIIPLFAKHIELVSDIKRYHITKTFIKNIETGSFILFSGIKTSSGDQTANLKTLPNITTWVIEEGEDFNVESSFDDIDDSIRSFSIQNRIVWVQNPSTDQHFIYQKFFANHYEKRHIDGFPYQHSTHPEVEHIHTTYLDNEENLNQEKVRQWKSLKIKNPKKYSHKYIGAWLDKAEGVIIENWSEGQFNISLPYIYGQDYGFAIEGDPTTLVKIAIDKKAKKIYCKEELYNNNMDTEAIVKVNKAITKGKLIVADSAEPRLISDLKKKGCNIIKCVKGQGSVTAGIKLLQGYELIIDPESYNLKKELNNYIWNDKKSGVPVDDWNHIIDAIRYAVGHLLQRTSHPGYSAR